MGRNWYAEWEEEKERREEEYWEQQKEEAEKKRKEEQARLEKERLAKLESANSELKVEQIYFIPTGNGRDQLSFFPPIIKAKKDGTTKPIEKSEKASIDYSDDENGVF